MPIYGYHCDACGNEFELLQSMKDDPLRTCDKCGGALRKLLYPVGISFKGSGFYTTDYKGSAKPPVESGSESGSAAASDGKSGSGETKTTSSDAKAAAGEAKGETKKESKSESKSETKSETKSEPRKPAATGGE